MLELEPGHVIADRREPAGELLRVLATHNRRQAHLDEHVPLLPAARRAAPLVAGHERLNESGVVRILPAADAKQRQQLVGLDDCDLDALDAGRSGRAGYPRTVFALPLSHESRGLASPPFRGATPTPALATRSVFERFELAAPLADGRLDGRVGDRVTDAHADERRDPSSGEERRLGQSERLVCLTHVR
jgi:hypothetical protein